MPDESVPDNPQGFALFYESIFGRQLPRHAFTQWIQPLYAAHEKSRGLLLTAFRGSSKTTTLSVAFTAFRIGLEPHKSNLIIQAGERSAADTSAQVAEIIEHNVGWKRAFTHVVPDRAVSWGADGYEVCDTSGDYAAWRATCMQEKGKDPTLIGLGYKSRAIIGRHPTGLLLIDDIHDETNTRSYRELEIVIKIVTGTILPTATPRTWQVVVGTPWRANDALAHLAASRQYKVVRTPIQRRGAPTWPQIFPRAAIGKLRKLTGAAEFARMYLLDLEAAQGLHLKPEWLQLYPHEKIAADWPVVMGVDYASSADKLKDRERDYFAVAVGRALPGGGIVLVDGLRAHMSQGEAEEELVALAARYPRTQMIGVETAGKGEEFFHLMLRTYRLPLVPVHPGGTGKGERFESGMAPLFERAQARIADVETPFIRAFREEWLAWPHGEHDDTLDAVAWMLHVGRPHIYPRAEKVKRASAPFAAFGRK